MANDNKNPTKKKKYEAPSITGPESEDLGKGGFVPLGATACSYGDIGGACADGSSPTGGPDKCSVGTDPEIPDCRNGTSAGNDCRAGTDAELGCSTGTRVLGDCRAGVTPLGKCKPGTSPA